MQVQIQALLAAAGGVMSGAERGAAEVNRSYQIEVAKPAIFNGEAGKVEGFIMVCRLYLRMKMREATVEEQVQWILLYVQEGLADVWKENVIEELEAGEMEYETVEEFLISLKKEFSEGEEELVGVKKVGARRKDYGGVHTGVQEGSKREWV